MSDSSATATATTTSTTITTGTDADAESSPDLGILLTRQKSYNAAMIHFRACLVTILLVSLGCADHICAEETAPAEADLILDEGFGPDCFGWSMTDWVHPVAGGRRPGENYVRLEDGLLKIYLGRGMLGKDKDDLWHGKTVSRPLELYADFRIECLLKWSEKNARTIMGAEVVLYSGRLRVASAGVGDAWASSRARGSGSVMSSAIARVPELPLSGQARVRFERTHGILSVHWDDKLLASKEAVYPITSFSFSVKGYHTFRTEGDHGALDYVRVYLPKPSVKLVAADQRPPAPNLVVGGNFEEKGKGAPDKELDGVMLEAEGLKGVGVGELLGWETDIDGRKCVWGLEKSPLRKHLRLEVSEGKSASFEGHMFNIQAGEDYRFSCLTRLHTTGVKVTVSPACLIDGYTREGGHVAVLAKPGVGDGANDWNWKRTTARFSVTNAKIARASITLSAKGTGDGGAALFDSVEVSELTPREREKENIASVRQGLMERRESLRLTGYKLETALDVLRFDLKEAQSRSDHAALAAEVEEFAGRQKTLNSIIDSAGKLYWAGAELIQFFDRVEEAEIARLREGSEGLRDQTKALLEDIEARETPLRKRLRALRKPRKRLTFKDNFEWARGRFHLYWQNHYGLEPPGIEDAFRYMGEMHTTIVQCAGRSAEQTTALADHEDIRTIISVGVSAHPSGRAGVRKQIKQVMDTVGESPAFAGLEFDEINFSGGWCKQCRVNFRKYLKQKYTTQELIELGILAEKTEDIELEEVGGDDAEDGLGGSALPGPGKDLELKPEGPVYDVNKLFPPEPEERGKKKVLWMEHREFVAHSFEEGVRDAFDYAHSLRKDALMVPVLSPGPILQAPFNSSLARVSAMSDMIGIDPYWNGCPEEAFYCDLMRANAKGPTFITVGAAYGGRPVSLKRDLSICFAHTDGMYVFDWPWVFKQPPYLKPEWIGYWMKGAWEPVWEVFEKAKRLEPFLIQTRSPAAVATLYSERSSSIDFYKRDIMHGMGGHYSHQQMGLYCLFMQARVQVDSLFAEGLKREKLDRYAVLFVQNAAALTPPQENLLRAWVKDGGTLTATASTTLLDRWGRKQTDYRLADVFGVKYVETRKSDGGATFGEDPAVRCSSRRGYDVVEATTGKVASEWGDGAPAVVTNTFGKGNCVFITARDIGRSFSGRERKGITERFPVYKKFSAGLREFVAGLTVEALKAKGKGLPFEVRNCPNEVETVMRLQDVDGGTRRILHLLNYAFEEPVQGVKIELPVGKGTPKVFYPTDGEPVVFERKGDKIGFVVRDFAVHEAIVVEF